VTIGVVVGRRRRGNDAPLNATTPAPTPITAGDFKALLQSLNPKSNSLNVAGTPQRDAFDWITSSVDQQLELFSTDRLLQRYALATLFYATMGDQWSENTNWLTMTPECEWYSSASSNDPICNDNDELTVLDLRQNKLGGDIPFEIGLLTDLVQIDLSGNSLLGALPESVQLLTKLRTLLLDTNFLVSSIPSEIGLLTGLGKSTNENVSRDCCTRWFLTGHKLIETLSLSLNELVGSIPSEVGRLSNLKNLDMGANKLVGLIPTELGFLSNLVTLNLNSNSFTGGIPIEIGQLSLLENIVLDGIAFTDAILPTELGLMGAIRKWCSARVV